MTHRSKKSKFVLGVQVLAFLSCSIFVRSSEVPSAIRIESPDHPPAWYLTGNFWKLSQSLRWDRKSQILYLDVTYSINGEWPNMEDSDLYKTLSVSFPQVKADRSRNLLYVRSNNGRNIPLARVGSSFFGPRTSLLHNVEISAHRQNGVLDAALVVKNH